MVFYRKYRPQKIQDLDNKELRERLFAVLSNNSIPHAFLFTGPKGLGKTSTARILAKAINCEKKSKIQIKNQNYEDIEPCNNCDQCVSITNGSNLDVLEIDGASNRGIDEIRDLREKIKLASVKAEKKIYIIDEVHMLTVDAFNALLKTLEEPPEHAMFIFCTTEFHKVPSTILSRCFQISFHLATEDEISLSLERIISAENISIDKEVVQNIARLSDGSFRDAAKILEELVGFFKGQTITKELVDSKYQVLNIMYYADEILKSIFKKDEKQAIEFIAKLSDQGIDMKYFLEQLMSNLHDILLSKVGVKNSEFRIQNLEFRIEEIKKLINLFSRAHAELKYAVIPQLPLELAVIEYCASTSVILGTNGVRKQESRREPDSGQARMTDSNLWGSFIDAVKVHNHTIAGVLRGCFLKSFDEKSFVIETAFKFHKERLSEQKNQEVLKIALQEITGKQVKVSILLKNP